MTDALDPIVAEFIKAQEEGREYFISEVMNDDWGAFKKLVIAHHLQAKRIAKAQELITEAQAIWQRFGCLYNYEPSEGERNND